MNHKKHKKMPIGLFLVVVVVLSACSHRQLERIELNVDKIKDGVERIEEKLDALPCKKPGAVTITKEEAAGIATIFAGLKKVKAVRQAKVIASHTQTYNVMGNDGKGDVLIGINPASGEVIKMVLQCPYPGVDTEKVVLSAEEALGRVGKYLKTKGLPPLPEGFVLTKPRLKSTWKMKHWEVTYRHFVGKAEVLSDFMSLLVNAETGEINLYSKVRHDVEVETEPKLSEQEAVDRAKQTLKTLAKGNFKADDASIDVIKTMLKIVYPNDYFDDFKYHWNEDQALAWVVQLGEKNSPVIDIWIDAVSGKILGGEMYERPVPKLWGIPNQEEDITNIWQPALDIMQYNTSTSDTHLGYAAETEVVNSIATGDYFILQTHGDTTSTAEYATIDDSGTIDERRLTPEEIPDNQLRYALVSCCKSAHDGSGQDFKDVFHDQGADVFQGYVEYINPDPYEQSLVRYLAEGQTLKNAHWNAYADTIPWFTIVFDYSDECWNRVRLAPLHVDVNAFSDGINATITATVWNREDAHLTTATNVVAELIYPAGEVEITGGINPQFIPTLNYGNSWTFQWQVRALLLTYGTKVFDVIVHSDNLGVEVDDFYNPYHKVNIILGWFSLDLRRFLEIDRWWWLAERLFKNMDEPGNILSLIKELDMYKSVDDVKNNKDSFLKTMSLIAGQEYKFGSRLLKDAGEKKEAILKYLEQVKDKIDYISGLQKMGLGDINKTISRLGLMQVKINSAAMEAFR